MRLLSLAAVLMVMASSFAIVNDATANIPAASSFGPPEILNVTLDDGTVTISWDWPADLTDRANAIFRIYCFVDGVESDIVVLTSGLNYSFATTIEQRTHTLTYEVCAVVPGTVGPRSSPVLITPIPLVSPPLLHVIHLEDGNATVEWSISQEYPEYPITAFRVYRKEVTSLVTDAEFGKSEHNLATELLATYDRNATTYVDTNATAGICYRYGVSSLSGGLESAKVWFQDKVMPVRPVHDLSLTVSGEYPNLRLTVNFSWENGRGGSIVWDFLETTTFVRREGYATIPIALLTAAGNSSGTMDIGEGKYVMETDWKAEWIDVDFPYKTYFIVKIVDGEPIIVMSDASIEEIVFDTDGGLMFQTASGAEDGMTNITVLIDRELADGIGRTGVRVNSDRLAYVGSGDSTMWSLSFGYSGNGSTTVSLTDIDLAGPDRNLEIAAAIILPLTILSIASQN